MRIHQFGKKVLLGIFLGYELIAGGIWKGDILIADIEELEMMDAPDIYPRRSKVKEVLISEFVFPFEHGRSTHTYLDVMQERKED